MTADDEERWLPVDGYEGIYEVSDLGRVRSIDRVTTARDGRSMRWTGRVLSLGYKPAGYPCVKLSRNNVHTSFDVHFLVTLAFLGRRPLGHEVRHLNGDARDARLENLTYGTHSENNLDMRRHGTHHLGRRQECDLGHALGGDNVSPVDRKRGSRACWACGKASKAERYAKKCGRLFDFKAAADAYYLHPGEDRRRAVVRKRWGFEDAETRS